MTKHRARLAWLAPRHTEFADVPGLDQDVSAQGRASLDALHAQMAGLGLFGKSTPQVQREAVRRLLSELRGRHVGMGVEW